MADLGSHVPALLATIQRDLFAKASQVREERTHYTESYEEFKTLMAGARPGLVYAPWCDDPAVEAQIKTETQATIRNIPFVATPAEGKACLKCGGPATQHAWFAKSY